MTHKDVENQLAQKQRDQAVAVFCLEFNILPSAPLLSAARFGA